MSKVKTSRVHLLLVKDSYYPSGASEVSDNRLIVIQVQEAKETVVRG